MFTIKIFTIIFLPAFSTADELLQNLSIFNIDQESS